MSLRGVLLLTSGQHSGLLLPFTTQTGDRTMHWDSTNLNNHLIIVFEWLIEYPSAFGLKDIYRSPLASHPFLSRAPTDDQ